MKMRNEANNGSPWAQNPQESEASYQFLFGAILLIGGIITVAALFITQANLNEAVIRDVLLPGCAVGTLLMLIGGIGLAIRSRLEMQKRKNEFVLSDTPAIDSTLARAFSGGVFLSGGVLLVFTVHIINENLGSPTAMDVLSFGCTAGMILLVAGAVGMGLFKKKDPSTSNS